MKNLLVSEVFKKIAELLEIKGDNPFRIRAYLRASQTLEDLHQDIETISASGGLKDVAGIGEDLASKIQEIIKTNTCEYYEELKRAIPAGVVEMLSIPSVGPKTAKMFYERLKIDSIEKLEIAAKSGKLLGLPGIKEKTIENILQGIAFVKKGKGLIDLSAATQIYDEISEALKKLGEVESVFSAGSLRRMKDTVRDIDMLAISKEHKKTIRGFASLPCVKSVLVSKDTKASILTKSNVQVDLRVLNKKSSGAGLLYFTGSKNHNIKLRQLAIKRGLKINEYGVFNKKNQCVASATEEEVYKSLGIDFIAPELREDAGEIEAALKHELPDLIELKDIKGDLHVHTNYSDGRNTIEEMVRKAIELGYTYIVLADHSVSLKIANGLNNVQLKKKWQEVDYVGKKFKNFRILFGTEVEIDSNGKLDYSNQVLSQFDVVVAAVHSGFKQSRKQLTQRIIRACENKYVNIIAHPTGKLLYAREPYELDFDEVFKTARTTNTALEINAHPHRLDLCDSLAHMAKDERVKLVISTDSHDESRMQYMKFGVSLARRAWLEKKDVLNTLSLDGFMKAIQKK